jgi:hypothetical protein
LVFAIWMSGRSMVLAALETLVGLPDIAFGIFDRL